MKNQLHKIASIGLISILTLNLFPLSSKVSASTEEPTDFMSLKEKHNPPSSVNNLKKDIKEDYESLFSGENLPLALNMLRFNRCKLLSVIIKYIHTHPALGIKIKISPVLLKTASNLNRETFLSDIIEYSAFVDGIKKEKEEAEKKEEVEGNIECMVNPSEIFRILNEDHLVLSKYIIRLYKNLGMYESLVQLNNTNLKDKQKEFPKTDLPRFNCKTPKRKFCYIKPTYINRQTRAVL